MTKKSFLAMNWWKHNLGYPDFISGKWKSVVSWLHFQVAAIAHFSPSCTTSCSSLLFQEVILSESSTNL